MVNVVDAELPFLLPLLFLGVAVPADAVNIADGVELLALRAS